LSSRYEIISSSHGTLSSLSPYTSVRFLLLNSFNYISSVTWRTKYCTIQFNGYDANSKIGLVFFVRKGREENKVIP
jgi:hypothetical protein